jgi:hypothetical protein
MNVAGGKAPSGRVILPKMAASARVDGRAAGQSAFPPVPPRGRPHSTGCSAHT